MARLRREAERLQRSTPDLVESALRLSLRGSNPVKLVPALPSFRTGGTLVDIESRMRFTAR